MAEPKDLIIRDFIKGVADSPHVGFAAIKNLDVTTNPGIAKINYKASPTPSTIAGLARWIVQDPNVSSTFYALTDAGKVYKSTDDGSTWTLISGNTLGSGEGLGIWKDYLFAFRSQAVDVYGPLSGTPAWSNSWASSGNIAATEHPALAGQDDILYFGGGRYVCSILEKSGHTFAPGDATSYTVNFAALTLPSGYNVKCLAELGKNLMIGTYKGTVYYQQKVADIFPWDRSSPSFNLPIRLNEFGVNQMLVTGNRLYAVAGREHTIFISDGYNVRQARKVARCMSYNESFGLTLDPYPAAIMAHRGKVYTGVSPISSGTGPGGVWSFQGEGDVLLFENSISNGTVSPAVLLRIGALISVNEYEYLISWYDGTSYGIDKVIKSERYSNYGAIFESPLYQVGTPLVKETFQDIEFTLAKPLATGQGIKLSYRKNLTEDYTLLGTYDYATYGAIQSFNDSARIADAEYVQIKCELTTGSATYTTPELREIRLR